MLKRFFISMLGTMAGLWLSFFIVVIGFIAVISAIVAANPSESVIKKENILYLCLEGDIEEVKSSPTIDYLNFTVINNENLCNIITAVRAARTDKKIKGIYIDCKGSSMGVASRSELIEALKQFKESGKWIYAYADNYAQGDYLVSTVADKIFLNPVGSLDVRGLGAQVLFYKNLFDKIGVEMNIVKVGSFKSAVEPYIRTDMSEPSRLQTSIYVNQIWNEITKEIALNRDITPQQVSLWADSLCFTWAPQRYVEQNAVTELRYRHEVEDALRSLMGIEPNDDLPLVKPADYLAQKELTKLQKENKKHIAVLYAVGEIVDDGQGGIVGQTMVPEILKLAADDKVIGLVLRVNSPGGSAFASEQIWKALEDFKAAGKPFYVSMGDYAASGGYYISCGADRIYADAATLTGSIGIFGMIPNAEKLMTEKIGINIDTVATSPNASFPDVLLRPSAQQLAAMQTYVERGYDTFTSRVAEGRDISQDSVKVIGGGRVWDGMTALNIGLVDEIGSLHKAVTDMADLLDVKATDYVNYPKEEPEWYDLLLETMGTQAAMTDDILDDANALRWAKYIRNIKSQNPIQARMEPVVLR